MRFLIIGGSGNMGQLFKKIFERDKHDVAIIGRKNWDELASMVKYSDIILLSVPFNVSTKITEEVASLLEERHAFVDLSSLMCVNKEAMKGLVCGSAFLHPLFGPDVDIKDKNMILSVLKENDNLDLFVRYLKENGANIRESSVSEHDKSMAYIQGMSHLSSILLAKTITDSDLSSKKIDEFHTIFFRLNFNAISRIFTQSAEMYANIQFHNEELEKALDDFETNLKGLRDIIRRKDYDAYEKLFKEVVSKLGDHIEESFKESQEMVASLKKRKKVGLLGPAGSFTDVASNAIEDVDKLYFDSISEVITAVKDGLVDKGVVPLENSLGGSVVEAMDRIYCERLKIQKVVVLPIKHCIAGLSKETPEIILSHPQSFMQCSAYIKENFPRSKLINALSNSEAFKKIADNKLVKAVAIGPKLAAEMYDLVVIDEDIQDYDNNETRFAVITKEDKIDPNANKTSLVIVPEVDRPGILFDILSHFKENKVNLCKIESRPSKEKLGVYVFHIEIDGKLDDDNVKIAVKDIETKGEVISLGSYQQVKNG